MNPRSAEPTSSYLYIVGVPIGNPLDISLRAKQTLETCDFLICEERKAASVLFRQLGLEFPREQHAQLNEHTTEAELHELVTQLQQFQSVAWITDAGMPVLCDPGEHFLALARKQGLSPVVVPGPTALTSALALVGAGGHGFDFLGYPPRKAEQREDFFRDLVRCTKVCVFYETPYRMKRTVDDFLVAVQTTGFDPLISLAVDLTGENEIVLTDTAKGLKHKVGSIDPGPPVFIVQPQSDERGNTSKNRNVRGANRKKDRPSRIDRKGKGRKQDR